MLPTFFLALLASLAASTPLEERQVQEPCAELSNNDGTLLNGVLVLQCLRSVPLQPTARLQSQIAGLRTFIEFQSDLEYLNSDDIAARLYPSVDILGGLDSLEEGLNDGVYDNEYDFQLDISRLLSSAYDGHLYYQSDIVSVFNFARVASGGTYSLISVSRNGSALPGVYAATDGPALAGSAGYDPSPVTEINGQSVEEFLSNEAGLTGVYHDPDANFNRLFLTSYPQLVRAGSFAFPSRPFYGSANEMTLTFGNGSEQSVQTVAERVNPNFSLSGVANGNDLFQRCCSGNPTLRNVLGQLSSVNDMSTTEASRDEIKTIVGPNIAENINTPAQLQSSGESLVTRQSLDPNLVAVTRGQTLLGSFSPTEPDLAILALPTFAIGISSNGTSLDSQGVQEVTDYQFALQDFLDAASEAGRTRLIIDLRGNGGGLGFLPQQIFRQIFPSAELPYSGGNLRANDVLNTTGTFVERIYDSPIAVLLGGLRSAFGVFAFDAEQQLDEEGSSFDSFSDFFGPVEVPSSDGSFTEITQTDYDDSTQTFPVDLTAPLPSNQQVFDAENIVLLQDGACASACSQFAEFMKNDAPGGPVRSIVLGGRSQEGPMQAIGGVKGGQLGDMLPIGLLILSASTLTEGLFNQFQQEVGADALPDLVEALNRSTVASVNYRNSIREDDSSATPLQYVYEAADCRLYYTAEMIFSRESLWSSVYEAAWSGDDGACAEGSTGHPSTGTGAEFVDVDVPDNAASSSGVAVVGSTRRPGGFGGGSTNQQSGEDEEGSAVRAKISTASFLVVFAMYWLA